MFRGNHPARVDEKGRLKVPAEFKRLLDANYGTRFFITSRDGKRAEVHPLEEWQKYEAKLSEAPKSNPQVRKLTDRLSYYGQEVEMDNQGRVLLPQILRESAGLNGDVVVFGKTGQLEVIQRPSIEQEMQNDPLTPADEEALADRWGL